MNVLVIGSGGREHALCISISGSKLLDTLYCLPGNPGIKRFATCIDGNIMDNGFILKFCKENYFVKEKRRDIWNFVFNG